MLGFHKEAKVQLPLLCVCLCSWVKVTRPPPPNKGMNSQLMSNYLNCFSLAWMFSSKLFALLSKQMLSNSALHSWILQKFVLSYVFVVANSLFKVEEPGIWSEALDYGFKLMTCWLCVPLVDRSSKFSRKAMGLPRFLVSVIAYCCFFPLQNSIVTSQWRGEDVLLYGIISK